MSIAARGSPVGPMAKVGVMIERYAVITPWGFRRRHRSLSKDLQTSYRRYRAWCVIRNLDLSTGPRLGDLGALPS
jgi:hypothetical protein